MAIPMRRTFALAAVALLAPALARAERAPKLVRWSDVVQLVEEHPRLAEAASRVVAASAGVRAAEQVPNPSLEASLGHGSSPETGTGAIEWSLALSIPLEWIAQRGPRVDAARSGAFAAEEERRALRLDVLLQLRSLYWSLVYDQAHLAALETTESQLTQLVQLVGKRVEKGEARPIELPRVETELEKVRNELGSARAQARIHRTQLLLWLPGLGEEFAVEPDFGPAPAVPELEPALEQVRSSHPTVRAAIAQVAVRRAETTVERRQRIPGVSLKGIHEETLDAIGWGAALTVEVPLWNWNSGRIAQAEALESAEERRRDAATRELLAAAVGAHGQCRDGMAVADRYRQQILPRAELAVATLEKTFRAGETSLLDVIDTQRVLGDARRDWLAAELQARLECSRLFALLGDVP